MDIDIQKSKRIHAFTNDDVLSDFDAVKLSELLKLTKTTKHAKRHFWLNDVCTCHGLLPSHSA